MSPPRPADAVDQILAQWQQHRPDLDTRAMGPLGRLKRVAALLDRELRTTFASFDLSPWEFDVLATLRRSGPPYRLAPTALFSALMVSSGTMTHRLQGLESQGWVKRSANPDDARSLMVELSPAGLERIDAALAAHVANLERLLAPLPPAERAALDHALSLLLTRLEA